MNMAMNKALLFILRWFVSWSYFITGLIGVITLGFFQPDNLGLESIYLDEAERQAEIDRLTEIHGG